jgi:hypothetical protein
MNSSISQIKISIKSLQTEQIKNRVSETEDKAEELDQTVKEKEKILRKHEWNMQDISGIMQRPNLQRHR